ncbi:hypothetical protein DL240_06995 [Lujinxingia litoralis]|uniref:Transposase IS200-like domain-containing protein n=1 Tax=Lujinxingia litoralis TaxID=2211119 RepID=A0A328CAC8_9DELT|nr:transposase [Lujinxingia litoralis]RAL23888.1 hypothetical protein DL240_06995 [Lujinxingia litoralis]
MGRPLRIQHPDTCYFITNRCFQERFLLTPSPEVNNLILAWLARSAKRFGVEIFFYVFMSNHFHMAVRAPRENLHRFMAYFQSNLAKDINRQLNRTGALFSRRYSAEPILDDTAMLEKWRYTMNNPVKAGLVSHIRFWPGVSSYQAHLGDAQIDALWLDRTHLRALRRRKDHSVDDELQAQHLIELTLTPFPALASYPPHQRQRFLRRALKRHTRDQPPSTRATPPLGAHKVRTQNPFAQPEQSARSPRPLCHTRCPLKRETYRQHVRQVTDAYRAANAMWRQGQPSIFPPGTIPPGWTQTTNRHRDLTLVYSSTSASSVQYTKFPR